MVTTQGFVDDAVFMPGTGAVFIGEVGTVAPAAAEVNAWLTSPDPNATIGTNKWLPYGHTDPESLPGLERETEGGEPRGSWENPQLTTTAITSNDSVVVTPIQWTKTQMDHFFGGVMRDGHYEVGELYVASEVALFVLMRSGNDWIGLAYPKTRTAPEGGLEPDSENFLGMPIRYTVLTAAGKPRIDIVSNVWDTVEPEEP